MENKDSYKPKARPVPIRTETTSKGRTRLIYRGHYVNKNKYNGDGTRRIPLPEVSISIKADNESVVPVTKLQQ